MELRGNKNELKKRLLREGLTSNETKTLEKDR